MRTLILIPTETEAAPLRAACPDAPIRIVGVGMAAAAAATTRIIAEEHPDRLILAGIAGASDRSVAVCEVVAVAGERIAELPGKYAVRYAADFTPTGLRTVESN
ncbi:MAG: phosphorylase, partial [Alistipes sp.]|nr:phosphorylase [Alistipes sp.]